MTGSGGKDRQIPASIDDGRLDQDLRVVEQAWTESGKGQTPPEPPELVDLAVMNMAERELQKKSRLGLSGRWSGKWPRQFATLAVMILALMIVVQQSREVASPPSLQQSDSKLKKMHEASEHDAVGGQKVLQDRRQRQAEAVRVEMPDAELPDDKNQRAAIKTVETEARLEAAATEPAYRDDMSQEPVAGAESADRMEQSFADAPLEEAPASNEPQPALHSAEAAQSQDADSETFDELSVLRETSAEPAGERQSEIEGATVAKSPPADQPARQLDSRPVTPDHELRADPESWLDHIYGLKAEGEHDLVRQELQAFRQAWPDYPLPDDLKNLQTSE